MVKFIIIRHGFSIGNKEKKFTGQLDLPLDEVGLLQAEATARYVVDNFKVDSIYSSDLSRAYDTAKPIADALSMTVNVDKGLREVDVGLWQGRLMVDVEKEFAESFAAYRANPGLSRFDGGESYLDFSERVKSTFKKIAEENDGKTVVVATHGGVVRTICAAWRGVPLDRLGEIDHVPNASVTVVEYDEGTVSFSQFGYCEHLAELATKWFLN